MPEFWQKTTQRAQETLAVWRKFLPLMLVGGTDAGQHATDVAALGELVQQRELRIVEAEEARRREGAGFDFIRTLNLAVPRLIEGRLEEGHALRAALGAVYAVVPRSDALNLQRARLLIPIWKAADAELTARKPGDRIVCGEAGVAELAQAVEDYPALGQATAEMEAALAEARAELRARSGKVDQMNKRAYLKLQAEARSNPVLMETLLASVTRENSTRKRVAKGGA